MTLKYHSKKNIIIDNENQVCYAGLKSYYNKNNPKINIPANELQIELCRIYIKNYTYKIDKIYPKNRYRSSYGWKHIVENHFNIYISNGSMIAAAIREGCKIRAGKKSINAIIYITEK